MFICEDEWIQLDIQYMADLMAQGHLYEPEVPCNGYVMDEKVFSSYLLLRSGCLFLGLWLRVLGLRLTLGAFPVWTEPCDLQGNSGS